MRKYKWNQCHQYDADDDDDEEAGKGMEREGAEDATKSVMSHVLVLLSGRIGIGREHVPPFHATLLLSR